MAESELMATLSGGLMTIDALWVQPPPRQPAHAQQAAAARGCRAPGLQHPGTTQITSDPATIPRAVSPNGTAR